MWGRIKYILVKLERFMIYRVMSLNDTPHRIALGVAIGIFVTFTPTIGFQMILTFLLSLLFNANKFVGVPFVWISNPLTIVPIYMPSYWLGFWLIGGNGDESVLRNLAEAVITDGGWTDRVRAFWHAIEPIVWQLWVGSLIVSAFLGMITYIVVYKMTVFYRKKMNLMHLGKESSEQKND